FIIPGIDNAAHIGGLLAGVLCSIVFSQTITARNMPAKFTLAALAMLMIAAVMLIKLIPAPKYRWSDELLVRSQISAFLFQDQAINRSWLEIIHEGKQGKSSLDELAGKIDYSISEPYAESVERLSKLPLDPDLPSAARLENILRYAEKRKEASKALAEKLRDQPGANQSIISQPPDSE
ncbi:MAG: rhomboid family intramembrane serine protease, partial [Pseudomonadota bacterium]